MRSCQSINAIKLSQVESHLLPACAYTSLHVAHVKLAPHQVQRGLLRVYSVALVLADDSAYIRSLVGHPEAEQARAKC